jgi:hypothetical protein
MTSPQPAPEVWKTVSTTVVAFYWLLATASNAMPQWSVEQFTDRMTDEVHKFVSLPAKEPSSNIAASLQVECISNELLHGLFVSIQLSEKMPTGATIRWRVDTGPVQYQHMLEVKSTSRSAIHKLEANVLRHARRVRIEWLTPSTGKVLFFDFDVSGADKALAQIPCVKSQGKAKDRVSQPPIQIAPR